MFQPQTPSRRQIFADRLCGRTSLVLVTLFLTLFAQIAFAQHVTNPFANATFYANPDYANEVNTAIAAEPAGSTLAEQMNTVANYPTAVWLDHIGAIAGGGSNSGRLSLQGHITAALAQQAASGSGKPIVVELVVYDLPDRDCAALASNGELSIAGNDTLSDGTKLTGTGLQEYESHFITPIYNVLNQYASNPNIRFVLVIEDDSLPNMITNTGLSYPLTNCIAANAGQQYPTLSMNGVYVQGITYALNQFHSIPNVYNYLDVGHHGWLGWAANMTASVPYFLQVAQGTTAGVTSIDGFITNTANYGPTTEPYMTANEEIGSNPVRSATFYQYDSYIDEESYAAAFDTNLVAAGFPSTLGFLIDTSRNGWGGANRPTGPSTSTVLDTFVNASRIDERDDMGQWCNQENQGLGVPPTVNPGGFANLQAYVWIKPPGESDGNYPGSVYNGVTSTTGDPNCDPAHDNALANNFPVNSIPNSPRAGTFWLEEFAMDVEDAYPTVPATPIGSSGTFVIATAGAASVEQGTTAASSVTVSDTGTFSGSVMLSITGLPAGVTATFGTPIVVGSAGSTLTFVATAAAVPGTYPLTVTGVNGTTTKTAALSLTVVAAPNFTISVPSTPVTLLPGQNPTDTITVTFVGGLTGSVSVSASNLPTGVSANFAPSSVNAPGGSIVVNFNGQTSTPSGTYSVSINGTNGTITHSTTLTLIVSGTSTFTLAPSAPALSIAQGKSGADTITVTGATSSVTLAASGLPSGVTAVFGTNPTTSSSAVTFTANSTVAAGTYPVTITGTSGTVTASTSIGLTITTGTTPSFTLAPAASTLSIAQGASGTDTVTVTDAGGFTGSVTLAASGLPSGVTAVFGTNPTAVSSSITFTTSSTVVAGTYPITITGTSGALTASTSISLTVTGGIATAITPYLQVNGAAWQQVSTATVASGATVNLGPQPLSGTWSWTGPSGFTSSARQINSIPLTTGANTFVATYTNASSVKSTQTFVITVTGTTPSFTLAPAASTVSIAQGASGTDSVAVTGAGGFTGSLTLAASGLPSGVTAVFGTNPTTGSSAINFAVSSTVVAGTYPITITGTSGTLTASTTIAVTVTSIGTGGFACHVGYSITSQWPGGFGTAISINNTGTTAITNWTLTWTFANGQVVTQLWGGNLTQSGANVTVTNMSYNGSIPAGGSYNAVGFNGTWNNTTNAAPVSFAVNGTTCN